MIKLSVSLLLITGLSAPAWAQQLLPEMEFFSKQKPGYLLTKDSQRIEVTLEKFHRKKGVIEGVTVRTKDDKTVEYDAADIREMALAPADVAKGLAGFESTASVYRAKNSNMKELNRDLVYFYHEYLDDQKRDVLVQLLNPGFDSKIRVYHDPFAGQTSGVGFGPVKLTGGIDKAYYIRANGKTFRLRKGDYEARFSEIFPNCPTLSSKYPASAWRDLAQHVYFFDQQCN